MLIREHPSKIPCSDRVCGTSPLPRSCCPTACGQYRRSAENSSVSMRTVASQHHRAVLAHHQKDPDRMDAPGLPCHRGPTFHRSLHEAIPTMTSSTWNGTCAEGV